MISLGISYNGYHDSSAALLVDDTVVFATSEERFTRICHDPAVPTNAIRAALAHQGITIKDLDASTIAWASPLQSFYHGVKGHFDISRPKDTASTFLFTYVRDLLRRGGARALEKSFPGIQIGFCDHHLAHALSAHAYSGFDESTVIVIDGKGSFETTSIWRAQNGTISPVEIVRWPNSLGLLYAKFTAYLGFKPLADEWKVMGLAAYGTSGVDLSPFVQKSPAPYSVNYERLNHFWLEDCSGIEAILGPRRKPDEEITQRHKDIAFAVQAVVEQVMLALVESAIARTGISNVCLAGGVVMNCKANGCIANSDKVKGLFIQPAASDEGAALGSAVYPYIAATGRIPKIAFPSMYLGSSFSDEEIEATLNSYKIPYRRFTDRPAEIADLLVEGNVIGHFNGRMEFGARALGNRSILADSRNIENKKRVNNLVKYREDWRPFAPSILEEQYTEYFDVAFPSPHMILSFQVRPEMADKIAATTHVDHTARPQTVSKQTNPDYWNLINAFKERTGVPVVLNTSFNLKGEPIVHTPTAAIRTFFSSGLDVLVLNNCYVKKSEVSLD